MQVTTLRALRECLILLDARKRSFSRNLAGVMPAEGYEEAFYQDEIKAGLIRDLIHQIESGKKPEDNIRRMPATWQKDAMEIIEGQTRMEF